MPHIRLPEGLPGILGPMAYRPETAKPLSELAEALLRGDSTLTRGERELIAAHVSRANGCFFCCSSHGAAAKLQLPDGEAVVAKTLEDPARAPVSEKMRALLAIAGKVQLGGRAVTEADVARARSHGAIDREIHDTVLIAAAFCMYNRYVDGLATWAPTEPSVYDGIGKRLAERGYLAGSSAPDGEAAAAR